MSNNRNYFKKRLIAYPEQTSADNTQVQSKFLYLLNAWQWLKENPMKNQDLYVSEFGWDSDIDGVTCNDATKTGTTSVGYYAQAIYTTRSILMMNRYGVKRATWYQLKDDKGINCPFAHFGGGVWKDQANAANPKYIFKALDKLIAKAGDLKFHYALKEWEGNNKDVFAYILEENNTPKYMVAWRAADVKDKTIAQMQAMSQVENINITVNGVNYRADNSQPQNWWQLDGENNTPITPSVYQSKFGEYKLSPIPILIPIKNYCNENSFAVGTLNIPAGTVMVSQNNIIVQPNTTLTINGTLLMAPEKNIYVAGAININGGTVSAACAGTQWGSIQVGTVNSTITVTNGKIEHANFGISNWGGSPAHTITATNSLFLNNNVDFIVLDAGTASTLTIQGCTLKIDNNYRSTQVNQRIRLRNTSGAMIKGCQFLNKSNGKNVNGANVSGSWYGITAEDAGFTVENNGTTRSTFEGFFWGIVSRNISGNNIFKVRNTDFINNTIAVDNSGNHGIEVKNNTFTIGSNIFPIGVPGYPSFKAGLINNTGTGYNVSQNTFSKGTITSNEPTFGTFIIETGTAPNFINNNSFSNLDIGNRLVGINRDFTSGSPIGLVLLCNTHTGTETDVRIEYYFSGIAAIQGSPDKPDGNSFTFIPNPANSSQKNYRNTTGYAIERFRHSGSPLSLAQTTGMVTQTSTDFNSSCASSGNSSNLRLTTTNLTMAFEEADNTYKNAKNDYKRVVDGGDKQGMINNIQGRWNRDSAAMRQNLLAKSPNLSTEVLLEAAKLGILSRNNLMALLKANINSCRDKKFHNSLMTEISVPLTAADIQQLKNTPSVNARKFDLEVEIGVLSQKREKAGRQIIRDILSERTVDVASLRNWYEKMGNLEDQYALAETYIKEPQSSQSIAKLRNLTSTLSNSEMLVRHHEDYIELYGIKSGILKSNRKCEQLNPSEERAIRRIATNTKGLAAVQAQNILCAVYRECPVVNIPLTADVVEAFVIPAVETGHTAGMSQTSDFSVYPNPANTNFTVDYNLKEDVNNAEVVITDGVIGKTLVRQPLNQEKGQYTWNVTSVAQGIYYVFVKNNGKTVWQTKAFVLK